MTEEKKPKPKSKKEKDFNIGEALKDHKELANRLLVTVIDYVKEQLEDSK